LKPQDLLQVARGVRPLAIFKLLFGKRHQCAACGDCFSRLRMDSGARGRTQQQSRS
jgi:hypothetical protein